MVDTRAKSDNLICEQCDGANAEELDLSFRFQTQPFGFEDHNSSERVADIMSDVFAWPRGQLGDPFELAVS